MAIYVIKNGPGQTSSSFAKVQTGNNVIKTMLQFVMGTGFEGRIIEFGIGFDATAAETPAQVEVIDTAAIAATVTATAAADIDQIDAAALKVNANSTVFQLGTALTGYTASAEGSIFCHRKYCRPPAQ